MNETVGVEPGIDEEILALFQNLELTAFAACGKLGIMGRAAVNVIDQVIVRRQRLGNLGKGDILMLKLLPGKLRPDLVPACRRRYILFRASVFYEVCILGCHGPHLTKAVGIVL